MNFLDNKTCLVTGGAGSLGSKLVEFLLTYPVKAVRVFDADEYGLFNLGQKLKDPRLRLLLGDVKDRERVKLALNGADLIWHFAAVKNLEITEYNIPETVRTNIDGTINIVEGCFKYKPEKFLYISSDKSIDLSSLYGATKFIGEKTTLWAQKINPTELTKFSCTRFGNVIESRGNVFDIWRREARMGELTITDPESKRYYWHVDDAINFIVKVTEVMEGGEIFVPRMSEFTTMEMAKLFFPTEIENKNYKTVGLRYNEVKRQELLTEKELKLAEERENYWILRER